MHASEMNTVIKLRFLSFKLIFATTQPSAHDSTITNSEIMNTYTIPPISAETVNGTTHRYTITAGRLTTAEYISPIR